MAFTYFDELGVEPLAFVGQPTDIKTYVPNALHKLYSGDKLNVLTRYVCGRYLNTVKDNRYIFTEKQSRFLESPKDNGNCK